LSYTYWNILYLWRLISNRVIYSNFTSHNYNIKEHNKHINYHSYSSYTRKESLGTPRCHKEQKSIIVLQKIAHRVRNLKLNTEFFKEDSTVSHNLDHGNHPTPQCRHHPKNLQGFPHLLTPIVLVIIAKRKTKQRNTHQEKG